MTFSCEDSADRPGLLFHENRGVGMRGCLSWPQVGVPELGSLAWKNLEASVPSADIPLGPSHSIIFDVRCLGT